MSHSMRGVSLQKGLTAFWIESESVKSARCVMEIAHFHSQFKMHLGPFANGLILGFPFILYLPPHLYELFEVSTIHAARSSFSFYTPQAYRNPVASHRIRINCLNVSTTHAATESPFIILFLHPSSKSKLPLLFFLFVLVWNVQTFFLRV